MHLVVGLGNPGAEYEHTRHNAGFDTLAYLADELGVRYWKDECGARVGHATRRGEEWVLAAPQSYMNCSGGPVKKLAEKYKVAPEDIVVIHDELDIPSGDLRVKFGGGHAGHNGLRSICDKLGTRDWGRVRVGIGRPPGAMKVADYVLTRPRRDEAIAFDEACRRASDAVLCLVDDGLEAAQRRFN